MIRYFAHLYCAYLHHVFRILICYTLFVSGRDLSKVMIRLFGDDEDDATMKRLHRHVPLVKLESLQDEVYNPMRNIHLAPRL